MKFIIEQHQGIMEINGNRYLLDVNDLYKIQNSGEKFLYNSNISSYPFFTIKDDIVTCPNFLFNVNDKCEKLKHKNGNKFDLKRENVEIINLIDYIC